MPSFLKRKPRRVSLVGGICDAVGDTLDEARATLAEVVPLILVQTATGDYLDRLARMRQLARAPASPALRQLTITVARAHRWNELLDQGRYASVRELAEAVGLSASYVGRVLNLTLLAPDIIQAVLRGNEPSGLSIGTLRQDLPTRWEKQRRVFETLDS